MTRPTVHIDFETFSEVSVQDVGLQNYAEHPSTDIICMAYKIGDGITKLWRPGGANPLPGSYMLKAHNVAFELAILENAGKRHGLPLPEVAECTAAKAAVMTYPRSLEGASTAMKLPIVKDTVGKAVMLQVTKPRKPSKTNPQKNWFFDKKKMNATYRYCIQDVDVECLIDRKCKPLFPSEHEVFDLDASINKRGVYVDLDLAKKAVEIADRYREELEDEAFWLTDCKVDSLTRVAKLKKYLNEEVGMNVGSLAKDKLQELLDDPNTPPEAQRLLELRKEASMTSIAKYQKIIDWTGSDSRLRNIFMYYGASTGRWTGKGPQLHNLPRGVKCDKGRAIAAIKGGDLDTLKEMGNPSDIISSCIRETFYAPEGKILIAGDYSGIELRVLMWLAGEEDMLQMLKDGVDPYKDMAADIYNIKIDDVTSDQRAVGKMAVLGLGYGMGHAKFRDQCAMQGITITEPFAKNVVKKYREKFKGVKALWRNLEMALLDTTIYGGSDGSPITFSKQKDYTIATLPSGRPLYYIDPQVEDGQYGMQVNHLKVNSVTRKWERRKTYGGMLCENIVQAIARDLLAEAMLNVNEFFDIVLHVHDEIVVEAEIVQCTRLNEDTEIFFKSIMETIPEWAKGIPIEVETWRDRRYRK